MSVRELLHRKRADVITVPSGTGVPTAARLLIEHGIGGLPVVSATGSVLGFVSERDIVRAVTASGDGIRDLPVERIMRRPPPLCAADDTLLDVMSRMTRERMRHLVVLDAETIAGVISVGDLVKHRLEQLDTETGVLRDYLAAQRASA
jgi:CBS domain-containing protein